MSNVSSCGTPQQAHDSQARRNVVGMVTNEERDDLRLLFERKNGLIELARVLAGLPKAELEANGLYDRVVADLGEVCGKLQRWWDAKSQSYGWRAVQGGRWEIDFETCEILLVTPNL